MPVAELTRNTISSSGRRVVIYQKVGLRQGWATSCNEDCNKFIQHISPNQTFQVMTLSQGGDIRPREAGKGRNPPEWLGMYFRRKSVDNGFLRVLVTSYSRPSTCGKDVSLSFLPTSTAPWSRRSSPYIKLSIAVFLQNFYRLCFVAVTTKELFGRLLLGIATVGELRQVILRT